MKKFLKWTGIVLGALVVIIAIGGWFVAGRAERELAERFTVNVEDITIPSDSISVARGQHLSVVCWSCHGTDFSGKNFFNDDKIGSMSAANLTPGVGGIGKAYTDKDWIRSLRHAVAPDGRGLFIMPSNDFANFSQRDLSCLIAYLKTLPPVDKNLDRIQFKFMGRFLYGMGAFGNQLHAKDIDHNAVLVKDVSPSVTPAYGEYIVKFSGCKTCHGPDLAGFKDPNPKSPVSPNLTPKGHPGKWNSAQFIQTLRSGVTPEGKNLDNEFMPWQQFSQYTDEELTSVFAFLQSVEGKEDVGTK